jgi:hypothetical protein
MTIAQMAKVIGAQGYLRTNDLQVLVTVLDIKQAYGRTRYVVAPVHGHGTATVEDDRVKLIEQTV